MNSCVWATVYLSKDENDFKRIIPNMEVQKTQTIVVTVQAQISNLQLRDQEIYGWRNYSLVDNIIATQFISKVNVFSDSVLCLGAENVLIILMRQ